LYLRYFFARQRECFNGFFIVACYRVNVARVQIVDVTMLSGNDCGAEIVLERSSVAFVRCGYFSKPYSGTSVIIDANYVVFGEENSCLLARGDRPEPTACTVIRYKDKATPEPAGACALASSQAFLMHARLLHDARLGRDIEENALRLLAELTADGHSPQACTHSNLVREIRRLVNESSSHHVRLDDIARTLYVSPFTVSRLFHRETGVSLREYAMRLRLRRALNLILHSADNLTAIALEAGFYDESHFSKAFRMQFGISPYSVRKYWTKSALS
jgi:AraC-like DNA-binding protein